MPQFALYSLLYGVSELACRVLCVVYERAECGGSLEVAPQHAERVACKAPSLPRAPSVFLAVSYGDDTCAPFVHVRVVGGGQV
eukprot:2687398-Rhodomonas_salina.2